MSYKEKVIVRLGQHVEEVKELMATNGLVHGIDYMIDGAYLQGSQNYNTHHEDSDVDSKIIVLPSFKTALLGTKLNHDFDLSFGEKASVKPLTDFIDLFWKGNINNLEMLTTPYKIPCPLVEQMIECEGHNFIPEAVSGTLWDASIGMMMQKRKSILQGTETTQPMVDKFGYDPKDAVHIARIFALLDSLSDGVPFPLAIDFSSHALYQLAMEFREGVFDAEGVVGRCDAMIEATKALKTSVNPVNDADVPLYKTQNRIRAVNYMVQRFK